MKSGNIALALGALVVLVVVIIASIRLKKATNTPMAPSAGGTAPPINDGTLVMIENSGHRVAIAAGARTVKLPRGVQFCASMAVDQAVTAAELGGQHIPSRVFIPVGKTVTFWKNFHECGAPSPLGQSVTGAGEWIPVTVDAFGISTDCWRGKNAGYGFSVDDI